MKLYKKRDIYFNGCYVYSTEQAKSNKNAVESLIERLNNTPNELLGLVDSRLKKYPQFLKARVSK